mgnify:FL=1
MNIQRFKELIEAYGTRSERWPEADRHAALIFLEADRDAVEIINELRRLDEALDADIVAQSTNLKADILHQISLTTVNHAEKNRDDLFSKLWRWLGPYANGSFVIWRPAIAACIPLLAGVYLGSVVETGSDDQLFEWEEDIYVMGLVSENEEQE